jgi:hypothetical protein
MEKSGREITFEEFYVKDQVLITGPKSQVDEVVATVSQELGLELVPARDGQMDFLRLPLGPAGDDSAQEEVRGCLAEHLKDILSDPSPCLEDQLGVYLYNIIRRQPTVAELGQVEVVANFINREGASRCVRSDPNWLIGYPYSVAGSPYSVAGSPYSVAGSPFADAGAAVGPDDFWEQWALERIGLVVHGKRNTQRCGQGVRVGVFDTSPFAEEGRPVPTVLGHPPLLTVVHPEVFERYVLPPPPPPQSVGAGPPPDPPDLSSHGLSVAGLVYAVAPHCDIYLFRVLDKYARGSLFVLCCALIDFMYGVISDQDAPNGGIISLSLGVPVPDGWQNTVGAGEIFALEIVLAIADCLGLTVVAAAGNHSAGKHPAEPAEVPARQPHVIGVMASNYNDDRSCFSNLGDLAAPGGEGFDCRPDEGECEGPWGHVTTPFEGSKCGLIGPVLRSEAFPMGFARWLGTSFATPLVSGMAALILEHHGGLPPANVLGEIQGHLTPGGLDIVGGIINVQGF